jgi:hypothetical protein
LSTKINNVLYLIGGTCTGKTTLARKLEERGFKWIRSVTSRPKRKGELDEYAEWVAEAEFNLRKATGEFDYVREYATHGETWQYGFRREDLDFRPYGRYVMVGDPVSAVRALDEFDNVLMLKAVVDTIFARLEARGCSEAFIRQRLTKDAEDFDEFLRYVKRYTRHRWTWDRPMILSGPPFNMMAAPNDFESDIPEIIDYIERRIPRP